MEINILKSSKDEIEFETDSLTLAEVLRNYLNRDSGVAFAAWKREHPTKNPIMKIQTKGKTAKKAVSDAVALLTKEIDRMLADFKKIRN